MPPVLHPRLNLDDIPIVLARNFTPASARSVDLVVLHSMESQEKPGTARRVAEWFGGKNAPQASAHYCVDDREIVQCVRLKDIAWHAPGANANGVGIEHAGRAAQSPEEWADSYSLAMLERSIMLTAALCRKLGIPAEIVTPDALKLGGQGITTHAFVSKAFKRSTHTDPGEHFPLTWYVSRVAEQLE